MNRLKTLILEKFKTLLGWDSTRFSADKPYANPELITLQVFNYSKEQKDYQQAFTKLEKCLNKKTKLAAFKHLGYYILPITAEENLPYQSAQALENLVLFMIQNNYAQKEDMHLFLFVKALSNSPENQILIREVQEKLFENGYFVDKTLFKNLAIREAMDDLPDDVDDINLMLMQEKIMKNIVQPFLAMQRPYESKRTLTERLERISSSPRSKKRKV